MQPKLKQQGSGAASVLSEGPARGAPECRDRKGHNGCSSIQETIKIIHAGAKRSLVDGAAVNYCSLVPWKLRKTWPCTKPSRNDPLANRR